MSVCAQRLSLRATKKNKGDNLCSQYKHNSPETESSSAGWLSNESIRTPCVCAHASGTHPLSGSHTLQFHLFQVGGSKRHVVINEVRDQRGGPVVF